MSDAVLRRFLIRPALSCSSETYVGQINKSALRRMGRRHTMNQMPGTFIRLRWTCRNQRRIYWSAPTRTKPVHLVKSLWKSKVINGT